MNEVQALAQPQEFSEAVPGGAPILGAIPGRRGSKRFVGQATKEEDERVAIYEPTHEAPVPSIPFQIKTASGTKIVMVKDKREIFTIPLEDLRARWCDVCVRPNSESVRIYDKNGGLLGRFLNWKQAEATFREAGILDAVNKRMKMLKEKREKEEAQARKEAEARKKAA